ncbi:MAG: restriction endonuclease [Pirellulales bacterium]|nr:restriction endonuclease [Pirellulales bacterium]
MAMPDFQALMLPMLQFSADGAEHTTKEVRSVLAQQMGLTPEECEELLPSGQQPRFSNRVAWAKTHLERAGLLQKIRRGVFAITDAGKRALDNPPDRIDIRWLFQFPGFADFRRRTPADDDDGDNAPMSQTPEEALEQAYQQIREDLAAEVLEQVKMVSPRFFERLVLDVMLKMGYGSYREATLGPGGADAGIDGVIQEDRLGLDFIYIQAKRWENPVGRPEIQKFVGALHGKHARKGVFITTSTFTTEATEFAATIDSKVVLVDGLRLAQLMIDFNVGVSPTHAFEIKRIDSDYFTEE